VKRDFDVALKYALSMGLQIHPNALSLLKSMDAKSLDGVIKHVVKEKMRQRGALIEQKDVEHFLGIGDVIDVAMEVKTLFDPTPNITSAEGVEGYASLFRNRFDKLKTIMDARMENKKPKTVKTVSESGSDDELSVAGLMVKRDITPSSVRLTLEDLSGTMQVMVFDPVLRETAASLLLDQYVAAVVTRGGAGQFVVKELIQPDIPLRKSAKTDTDVYAAFVSDLHVGSRYFMESAFLRFVEWLSSDDPMARRVGFVVIGGDIVDGVGIFPNQDKELMIQTVEEQLACADTLLAKIPSRIKVIITPGNHDPGRRALPQPAIPEKYCESLWERPNFIMIGNPSMVSLNGVKVLIYHGQSLYDVAAPGLTQKEPTGIMRLLLQTRHLGPEFGASTPIAPESEDMLVIDQVPDIFQTGHVHIAGTEYYRGILLLNSGAFQGKTPFQANKGIEPTPGLALIVNLKTFKVKYMDFGRGGNETLE